ENHTAKRLSSLINGEHALVQLQDGQRNRGGVNRADIAPAAGAGPAAILLLVIQQKLPGRLAVLAPLDAVRFLGFREQLGVAVVAEEVDRLSIVVIGVLIVAHAAAGIERMDDILAVLKPLLGERGVVLACTEAACNGSRRQGGPLATDA